MIENITEFLGFFRDRNVVGDDELGELVDKARAVMKGIESPDDLRTDRKLRSRVRKGLAEIKKTMDKDDLIPKPTRRIRFENGSDGGK